MTTNGIPRIAPVFYDQLAIEGFKVSWAGGISSLICYGSEDGGLKFFHEGGTELFGIPPVSPNGEAINDVASIGNCIVATTRSEIVFMWNQAPFQTNPSTAVLEFGAHGILATRNGYFIAPMGHQGLMAVKASDAVQADVFLINDDSSEVQFYRSIALDGPENTDVIVSAVRDGGITAGILPLDLKTHVVNTITPKSIDVVDVCSLGSGLAVAALGRDGTLMLFRDILNDQEPANFRFKSIEGVAYRLLSARGHVFVLTNKALYMVADLAKRVIDGDPQDGRETQILTIPMTAVDANVFQDKYILVVNDKSNVFRVYLDAVERDIPHGGAIQSTRQPDSKQLVNGLPRWIEPQGNLGPVPIAMVRKERSLQGAKTA